MTARAQWVAQRAAGTAIAIETPAGEYTLDQATARRLLDSLARSLANTDTTGRRAWVKSFLSSKPTARRAEIQEAMLAAGIPPLSEGAISSVRRELGIKLQPGPRTERTGRRPGR